MELALRLAEKGRGYVNPNPMVGAVIVKNNRIAGKGYHCAFGGPHAEINALNDAGAGAKGSTMYVTLEPCRYFGKTPPCTNAIITSGIKKVVVAVSDPNPLNCGRGIRELRKYGIKVETGYLKTEARKLNENFFTFYEKKRPFISIKCAMTLDGKIATVKGESKWITSEKARNFSHLLRHEHDAIMVGINTIKADDPLLSARFNRDMRKPCIVIPDSQLSISPYSNVIKNAKNTRVIIATTKKAHLKNIKRLTCSGAGVLAVSSKDNKVSLSGLIKKLARLGITSVLVEGGGELAYSILEEKLADKIYFFYAPKIIGGKNALTAVEGKGISDLNKAIRVRDMSYSKIGEDILITGYPVYE